MAKFVYLYTGGQMAETPEAQQAAMQAWGAWFGTLGDAVVDMGNAFTGSATLSDGGATAGGASHATGYSVVTAEALDDATSLAKGCPILAVGGSVEVYETLPL